MWEQVLLLPDSKHTPQQFLASRLQVGLLPARFLWSTGSKLCPKVEVCTSQSGRSVCAHLVGAVGLPQGSKAAGAGYLVFLVEP